MADNNVTPEDAAIAQAAENDRIRAEADKQALESSLNLVSPFPFIGVPVNVINSAINAAKSAPTANEPDANAAADLMAREEAKRREAAAKAQETAATPAQFDEAGTGIPADQLEGQAYSIANNADAASIDGPVAEAPTATSKPVIPEGTVGNIVKAVDDFKNNAINAAYNGVQAFNKAAEVLPQQPSTVAQSGGGSLDPRDHRANNPEPVTPVIPEGTIGKIIGGATKVKDAIGELGVKAAEAVVEAGRTLPKSEYADITPPEPVPAPPAPVVAQATPGVEDHPDYNGLGGDDEAPEAPTTETPTASAPVAPATRVGPLAEQPKAEFKIPNYLEVTKPKDYVSSPPSESAPVADPAVTPPSPPLAEIVPTPEEPSVPTPPATEPPTAEPPTAEPPTAEPPTAETPAATTPPAAEAPTVPGVPTAPAPVAPPAPAEAPAPAEPATPAKSELSEKLQKFADDRQKDKQSLKRGDADKKDADGKRNGDVAMAQDALIENGLLVEVDDKTFKSTKAGKDGLKRNEEGTLIISEADKGIYGKQTEAATKELQKNTKLNNGDKEIQPVLKVDGKFGRGTAIGAKSGIDKGDLDEAGKDILGELTNDGKLSKGEVAAVSPTAVKDFKQAAKEKAAGAKE